jgi:putative glutamine amidotransferase
MKPLIAIPRWRAPTWERTGYYLDSLEAAGARCRMAEEKKLPEGTAGLLLMGGVDVDPALYKEKRSKLTDRPHKERDAQELALLHDALDADIPVLAICRGHQLLNVALGGTLLQDIPGAGHKWLEDGDSGWHDVALTGEGHIAKAYPGHSALHVNSRHHQGVTLDRLAPNTRITATSHDGYVEAFDHTALRWVTGVQWHPERPEMREDALPLFRAFVAACVAE